MTVCAGPAAWLCTVGHGHVCSDDDDGLNDEVNPAYTGWPAAWPPLVDADKLFTFSELGRVELLPHRRLAPEKERPKPGPLWISGVPSEHELDERWRAVVSTMGHQE